MVLTIKGTALEETAPCLSTLYLFHKFPGLKEHSAGLVTEKSQVFGPTSLLYVGQREFGVTHSHDTKVQVSVDTKSKIRPNTKYYHPNIRKWNIHQKYLVLENNEQ